MTNKTKPNFIIIGAMKAATTSLYTYLKQHPDVFMSRKKEPHFLISKEIGSKRIPSAILDIKEYKMLFQDTKNYNLPY